MPLFKGQGSKCKPDKALDYITDDQKAEIVSTMNLDDTRSYAKQFRETAKIFNKTKNYDERKYYHFKLSCDRADNVSPEAHHAYAEEMAKILFPDFECVIATHTDTKTVHSHIIVNSVSFVTGKKLNIRNKQYGGMKDTANEVGLKRGFTPLNFRKRAKDRVASRERHTVLSGGTSWKEELREVIAEAKMVSANMQEFIEHLSEYGVTVTRNTENSISFLHPMKAKAIRGEKLGEDYTKGAIMNELSKYTDRAQGEAERSTERPGSNREPDDARAAIEKFDAAVAKSRADIEADDRAGADKGFDKSSVTREQNRDRESDSFDRER